MKRDLDNIRFNTLRNALYHTARRRFFERWNRVFNFAVVLLGAAAIADAARAFGWEQIWIGLAVAATAAAQLVFDFGRMARDHQTLQRDYYHLLAEIDEAATPTIEQLAQWSAKMTRIAGDEPPVMRATDAKAYNDALGATDIYPPGERLVIPFSQQLLGSFFAFEGHNYEKISEIETHPEVK